MAQNMNDVTGIEKVQKNFLTYVANVDFLKGVLTAMQAQRDENGVLIKVDSSACLKEFDSFTLSLADKNLGDSATAKKAYEKKRKDKGQQGTTNMGFWISFYGEYQSSLISGFNFYNECQFDYYMQSIGNSVQNPSGIANLAV